MRIVNVTVASVSALIGAVAISAAQSTAATPAPTPGAQTIPAHPRDLKFSPLSFEVPQQSRYRHVLANRVVVYMVEDRELPLVTVTVLMKGGSYVEPAGKEGLAGLVGSQIRAGGTATYTAEQFDEELDFLAASVSTGYGATSGSASVDFLAKDADRALALFFEMLRAPRFQPDRLDLARRQQVQALERRNDSTASIEGREWARLMWGDRHFSTARVTKASLDAVTRDDLVAFHQKYVHPANFIIAVAGDFKTADMKARLEKAMDGWAGSPAIVPPVPAPAFEPTPGVYMVHKPDVNQGRVTIGHLGIARGNPDEVAIELMNDVLGGSGFTSRITNRVRSDEGLAYSAGSGFAPGIYYPGTFAGRFQSKSASCARAAQIILDEIARIRNARVAPDELDTVKTSAIETFPRNFATAGAVASTFANDELTGRDPKFWVTYRERVRAVTVDDIQRVAQKYLQPDRLVVLAVGNVDDLLKGDPDRPDYSFQKLARGGTITRIPLPDPVTMVYPATGK